MSNVNLYFKENYGNLNWPSDHDAQYLKNYFEPLILEGTQKYISNVKSHAFIIQIGDKVLPGILATHIKDCYVSSPYSHYISYAIKELREIDSQFIQFMFKALLSFLGVFLKSTQFNEVVYVNNWLLSTNLYIDLTQNEIKAINDKLKESFPKKVIIYRSLNEKINSDLMKNLDVLGAKRTLSRQVYISDPFTKDYLERKDFHKDRKFLAKSKLIFKTEKFDKEDLAGIKKLYDQLYIDKYFDLNPQFTPLFFENASESKLFHFTYLTEEKKPKAILGYFERAGSMTTPIFGFDTDAPSKEGLYRLISAQLMQESEKKKLILNQSSGASHFKSQRGAKPFIEYNYYFSSHVSLRQKMGWSLISSLLNTIGVYTLKKFKL